MSLVLGILGVVCLPFTGVLSLIFGILGIREIGRSGGRTRGKGMAVTGTVLGSIGTLFTLLFLLVFVRPILFGGHHTPTGSAVVPAPDYAAMAGEGLRGSGFHFEWEGRRFIACSLHQFDGAVPKKMFMFGGDLSDIVTVEILDRVHTLNDVQVLTFVEEDLEGIKPLSYDGDTEIHAGDQVYVLSSEGPLAADMMYLRTDRTEMRYARLREHAELNGLSGSAVVSGMSGAVIGVMLVGDESQSIVGFELLELPRDLLREPRSP